MTSIIETLHALDAASAHDDAYILAAAINIYSESIRRREGRILYGPVDVQALFTIMSTLIEPKPQAYQPSRRKAQPTEEETAAITDVYEAIQDMTKPTNGRRV